VDLWVIPTDGTSPPFPFIDKTTFEERLASFSSDQRWVLYQSDESGTPEIYIRPFPAGPGQWKVSHGGGTQPRWNHDGTEVYWIAPDAKLMMAAVSITTGKPGPPVSLFQTQIYMGGVEQPEGGQYDVAPDGRFLINTVDQPASTAITVVQHWRGLGR
jgi:serine/threonine-protein kinase